jgi:hypothetical protein
MQEIEVISNSEKTPNLMQDILKAISEEAELFKNKDSFQNSFNRICLDIANKFNCRLDLDEGKNVFISNLI